jgi:uncharacterized coiled-coil DUF342 family protein
MRREIESVKKIVEDIDTFFYPIEEMWQDEVNELESKIDELENKVQELEDKIEELKSGKDT